MSKKITNKTLAMILVAFFIIMFGVLSFYDTSTGGGGDFEAVTFFTSTPEKSLDSEGWWDGMPTPIDVQGDPNRPVTPTPKP